jgi:hypothetical protein
MATITVNTFLDGGTARTAGETWTNNGGSLTIRTDTRVHANAPASMTGTISNVTCSLTLGGGYKVDGTKVREVYFSGGSGTVPAIGTTISQGGVSGYLLGVWPNLTSAPTTPGSAMPATGFLKFREVTGGSFASGALTGITATATGADVVSWLEVVHDQGTTLTMSGLGDGLVTDGLIWIAGTTTGTPGQQIQFPTNGGGAGTLIPAVLIETSPGSGIYESYNALYGAARGWSSTYLLTDKRAKFVQCMDGGIIRIGSNGAANCGYTPPSGCKIAIYNIFLRQSTAAARASNAYPSTTYTTRPRLISRGCKVDVKNVTTDWYLQLNGAQKQNVVGVAYFDALIINSPVFAISVDVVNGVYASVAQSVLLVQNATYDKIIANIASPTAAQGTAAIRLDSVSYASKTLSTFEISSACGLGTIRSTTNFSIFFNKCTIIADKIKLFAGTGAVSGGGSLIVKSGSYVDRLESSTNATVPQYSYNTNGLSYLSLSFDCGEILGLSNCNPYAALLSSASCLYAGLTQIGEQSDFRTYANPPNNIINDGGYNTELYIKRVYLQVLTAIINPVATTKRLLLQDCYSTPSLQSISNVVESNVLVKGCGYSYNQTPKASLYGMNYTDGFSSNTNGHITLAYNAPTSDFLSYINGAGYIFDVNGGVVLANVGNWVEIETQYYLLKHDNFKNLAPVLLGTNISNLSIEYRLDTGSGYGSYKTLSATNLSAETISPSSGFKLSIRATCVTAAPDNTLQYITILTNSSLASQTNYLYPLNTAKISISGLSSGTNRIYVYDVTNSIELINTTSTTTTFGQYAIYNSDAVLQVRVMQATSSTAKILYEILANFTIDGAIILVNQADDTIYAANSIDGFSQTGFTIDDATLTISVNKPGTGSPTLSYVTWQEAYAAETAWLTTAAGIRHFPRVLFASDTANYKLLNGFKIKNTGSYPLIISGGYGVSGTTGLTADIIDYSGGAITTVVEHVVPYQISSGDGGLTTDEHNQLMSIPTTAAPSTTDIWTATNRTLTDKTDFTLANNSISSSTIANNALDNKGNWLTDKTGYSLTTGERAAIATEVEAHLLDEGDSQLLINAIVGAIGNTNVDEASLVALIRADLERTGGKLIKLDDTISNVLAAIGLRPTNPILTTDSRLDNLNYSLNTLHTEVSAIPTTTLTTTEHNALLAIPTNPLLTDDTRLLNLDATISSRMASFTYTTPPTASAISSVVWADSNRSLTDKVGFGLSSTERELTAAVVEAHLLDEGDSQMLINAIVGAIGNQNIDEVALVAAIRSDLERTGGKLINLDTTVSSVLSAINLRPTNPLLVTDSRLNTLSNLDTTVSSRMATFSYVAPDNMTIGNIYNKVSPITFTGSDIHSIVSDKTGFSATITNITDIRNDLERTNGLLDNIPTLTEINASTTLAKKAQLDTIEVTLTTLPLLTDIVNGVFNKVIEGSQTFIENIRIVSGILKGKTTGIGTNIESFKSKDETKTRYQVEFDQDGNRINITEDGS